MFEQNSDEQDEDSMFYLPNSTYIGGDKKQLPLREIKERLEVVICALQLALTTLPSKKHNLHKNSATVVA